jgi:excisionase family DNA binding protein
MKTTKAMAESSGRYVTLQGENLDLTKVLPVHLDFLKRVQTAATDPKITHTDLAKLIWSGDNPLLVTNLLPSRAMATRESFENPAFRAMRDVEDRKRLESGDLDLERARARYTMTVPEAAGALGVAESTVRRAVKEGRLAGWKKGGVYYLDPNSVESYRVSTRGPRAEVRIDEKPAQRIWKDGQSIHGALSLRLGTEGDFVLRVKGAMITPYRNATAKAPAWEGLVQPGWRRIAVLRGKKKERDYRFFVLEPSPPEGPRESALEFANFYVRGDFRVSRKINNPRKAIEAWESFDVA